MHPVLNLEEGEHCMPDPTLALLPSGPLEVLATWPQGSLWCLWPADVPSPRIESGQNFVLPSWNTSPRKIIKLVTKMSIYYLHHHQCEEFRVQPEMLLKNNNDTFNSS